MFTSVDRLFDSRSDFVPNLYDLSLYIVLSSFTHRRLTAQLFFGIGSHPGVTPGIKPPTLDKNQVYQLIQSHSDLRKDGGGRVQYLHYFLLALCAQVNPLFLAAPSASWLTDEMPLRLYASTNRGVKGGGRQTVFITVSGDFQLSHRKSWNIFARKCQSHPTPFLCCWHEYSSSFFHSEHRANKKNSRSARILQTYSFTRGDKSNVDMKTGP